MLKRVHKYLNSLERRIEMDFMQNNLCNADWFIRFGVMGRIARQKYTIEKIEKLTEKS